MKTVRAIVFAILAMLLGPFTVFGLGPECDKAFNELRRLPPQSHPCWKKDIDFLVEWGKRLPRPSNGVQIPYPPDYYTIPSYGLPTTRVLDDKAFWDSIMYERPIFGK